MTTRRWTAGLLVGTLATCGTFAALGAFAQPADAPTDRAAFTDQQAVAPHRTGPNVVVLMTDDQTVADLEVMPRARRLLGERGVTFNNSYVSYPVCCPSRASFLSGQYAHNHGVLGLYPPRGGYGRFDRWNSLPVWLEDAGYATAHIGKYMNGYGSQVPDDVPPGWTEWYGAVDDSTYRMWGYTLNENGERHTYGSPFDEDPDLYQTDVCRYKAVDFIERRAPSGRPFFLSVAFLAPHHESDAIRAGTGHLVRPAPRHAGTLDPNPLPASPAFGERDLADKPAFVRDNGPLTAATVRYVAARHQDRQESLLAVDDAIEAIVAALRRRGELDDTYILLTSDNGYMQGEHDVPSGKVLPYEPSTRVPLLLRGPGVPHGRTSQELVANIDLAPTIAAVAAARPGKPLDGRSLLPFARHPHRVSSRPLLHETTGPGYTPIRDHDAGEAGPVQPVLGYRAVRTERWLYVEYSGGPRELYDLRRDPYELHSLHAAPSHRRVRVALHQVLRPLATCRGAPCRAATPPIPEPAATFRRR
jgi:N-acetylglucosamine-6-sulfatase